MRRFSIIFLSLLFPFLVQAQCLENGYTVIYTNGIFNTREEAEKSRLALKSRLGQEFRNEPIIVRLGYNPSHLAGLGDLTQIFAQSFGASVSSFDRDTILLQIHPEVTTRKVFLVGHSQGTLYTNNIYNYLVSNGEPRKSVGVYNIATPANYVAGGGTYLTSNADILIARYEDYTKAVGALPPLAANAQLDPGAAVGNGHNFIDVYLTHAGERMVREIQQGLSGLRAEEGSATEGCFTPPKNGLGYKAKQVFFAVADPAAVGIKVVAVTGVKGTAAVFNGVTSGLAAVGSFFGSVATAVTPVPRTKNLPGSHSIVAALYGSSVTEKDLKELLGTDQAGAVALVVQKPAPELEVKNTKTKGEVRGTEIQKPASPPVGGPLIPPPHGVGLVSPGFGGGGGTPPPALTPAPVAPTPPKLVSITYTFTSSDENTASTVCSFDAATSTPCDGSFSEELGPGAHTFTITATDAAGNQTTETRNFIVLP